MDEDEYFTYIAKGDCLTDHKFYKYSILPELYDFPSVYLPVNHSLEMTEFYVKEGTDSFFPGKCNITLVDYDSNGIDKTSIDDIAYSIDFTPEESGVVKYDYDETGSPAFIILGSLDKEDSKAYKEFNEHVNQWINNETLCLESRTKGYPENVLFINSVYGTDGHCYKFLVYSDQSILQEHMRNTVIQIHIVFVILALLVALIRSLIIIAKNKSLLRLIDYRKTLMNTMAHDLKTPLSVMSGYAENLKENVNTDKREHYANAIYENSIYMDSIISDVLELSRTEDSEIRIKGDGSSIIIENEPAEHFNGDEKRLWEPFVKGDESRGNKKGTGVGLSIVRNIMSNTGFKGKIEVTENTFRVAIRKKKLL